MGESEREAEADCITATAKIRNALRLRARHVTSVGRPSFEIRTVPQYAQRCIYLEGYHSVHHYEGSLPPGARLNALRLVDQSGERWVGGFVLLLTHKLLR